jgi:drug/metabolite transporter (DMT)-like permease
MSQDTIKLKQELYSISHAVIGCAVLSLVLAGIGGTIYKVISPEGWIAQVFGRSLSAGAAALGSIALVAFLAWFSRSWGDPRTRTRASDFVVYGFAVAGFAYLAQYWVKGTF